MASPMAMVNTNGKMDNFIRDNGLMDLRMDRAYGEAPKGILILDSGSRARRMATACILGLMAIVIKANFNSALNMDKESISLPMATLIKDPTLTVSHKGTASTSGTMEVHIKETSKMD